MSTSALDPQIHHPERLRVVATLAALPDGDALALTRLQGMLGLTPGRLIARSVGTGGQLRCCAETRPRGDGGRGRPSRSPAMAGPRWIATPPRCDGCPW